MPAWRTCARCDADLYPRLAHSTDEGWVCAHRAGCTRRAIARARCEDIAYMAETGECASEAAKRLGISRDSLENYCRRYGLIEQWHQMLRREPRDWNVYVPYFERKAS